MKKIDIEMLDISSIKPYEKNARTHPKKQIELLAENIKRFGFTTPVLIDKDNNLIAGHGRLEALKTLGETNVPAVRMEHLSPDEVKALRLADNQLATMSDWDMDLVVEELKLIPIEMAQLTGFDESFFISKDFDPASAEEQGNLSGSKMVTCPVCQHEFKT